MTKNKIECSISKTNCSIQISNSKISLIERKCFNILLLNAIDELKTKDTYSIRIADLQHMFGFNYSKEIQECCKNLVQSTLKFSEFDEQGKESWTLMPLLASAKISEGYLFYSFCSDLQNKLSDMGFFDRINLTIQNRFKNKYTLELYELCMSHYNKKKGGGCTPFIEIQSLRKLLGCAENISYDKFYEFNRFVLKNAIKKINDKTDIFVIPKQEKLLKTVKAIQFIISDAK